MAFAGDRPPERRDDERKKVPWCTLGDYEYKLIMAPSRYSTGWKWNWVEHDRIEGKPTLQQVGGTLRKIDLDLHLHGEFCNPEKELQTLIDLANKGEAIPVVIGEKYQGLFVIEDLPLTVRKTTEEAALLAIEVTVTLKEWVGVKLERKPKTESGFVQRDRTTFSGIPPTDTA